LVDCTRITKHSWQDTLLRKVSYNPSPHDHPGDRKWQRRVGGAAQLYSVCFLSMPPPQRVDPSSGQLFGFLIMLVQNEKSIRRTGLCRFCSSNSFQGWNNEEHQSSFFPGHHSQVSSSSERLAHHTSHDTDVPFPMKSSAILNYFQTMLSYQVIFPRQRLRCIVQFWSGLPTW